MTLIPALNFVLSLSQGEKGEKDPHLSSFRSKRRKTQDRSKND